LNYEKKKSVSNKKKPAALWLTGFVGKECVRYLTSPFKLSSSVSNIVFMKITISQFLNVAFLGIESVV
jgi:hypothetical protein